MNILELRQVIYIPKIFHVQNYHHQIKMLSENLHIQLLMQKQVGTKSEHFGTEHIDYRYSNRNILPALNYLDVMFIRTFKRGH